jgi:hypothetical protein
MCGKSGCDGCRLSTRGSSLPIDGREEAVSLDLTDIWALEGIDIQDLSRAVVRVESVNRLWQ